MYLPTPRSCNAIDTYLSPVWSVSVRGRKRNIEYRHLLVFSEAAVSPPKGQKCSGPVLRAQSPGF